MQISSRFTIAVHVLIAIETFKTDYKITSEFLASSHRIMDYRLEEIQNAMEDKMRRITLADVMADANKLLETKNSRCNT